MQFGMHAESKTQCWHAEKWRFNNLIITLNNVLQQTASLVVNPITVRNFAFLFNCSQVDRTSDSMTVRTYIY